VAELLAAWRMVEKAGEPGIKSVIQRIRSDEGSGLALAIKDAQAMAAQEPVRLSAVR
jgi:hypothetical protein